MDKRGGLTAWRRGTGSCTSYPLGYGSAIIKRASVKSLDGDVHSGLGGRRSAGSCVARTGWAIIRAPVGDGAEGGPVAKGS